jgi:uncharacterized protein YaaW (UPF0174 family)
MYDAHVSPVLQAATDAQLKPLADFLCEHTTSLLKHEPAYKRAPDRPSTYIPEIVKELRLYGGHSIKDRISGAQPGANYIDMARDAHRELGLGKTYIEDIHAIEEKIVRRLLHIEFDSLPEAQQREHLRVFYAGEHFRFGLRSRTPLDDFLAHDEPGKRELTAEHAKRVAADKAADLVMGKLKGKLLKAGARLVLKRMTGPIWLAMDVWSLLGPAYRVTLPAISYIHYLRVLQRG